MDKTLQKEFVIVNIHKAMWVCFEFEFDCVWEGEGERERTKGHRWIKKIFQREMKVKQMQNFCVYGSGYVTMRVDQ